MPNHVYNRLKVRGPVAELSKLKEFAILDKDNPFSIQTLIPMPKDIENTDSPQEIVSNIEYAKIKMKKEKTAFKQNPLTETMSKRLIRKYGCNNWYDWAIRNWGTKWGSYSSSIKQEGKTFVKYDFDSAWSPPIEGLIKISKKYPTLNFELKYEEEGMGFKGKAIFENGEIIEDIEY